MYNIVKSSPIPFKEVITIVNISQLASDLLLEALESAATDLHFHPLENEVTIHLRIHGERSYHKVLSTHIYEQLLLHFKFSSGMDIGKKNFPQNGTMSFHHKASQYFLRLSTLPSKPLESLAIRILPMDNDLYQQDLFLFPQQFKSMNSLLHFQSGLILFSGTTGSGKTTTMYSLLQTLQSKKSQQAITLENPIEKHIPNILQIEINPSAGLTYEKGLQAVLRHDPDIILIGEILSKELAQFALEAALTGHLVLSTLHAKDAQGTIDRLLAMDFKKIDLIQSLIAVISLQLIPITMNKDYRRRAAIAEILNQEKLINYLQDPSLKKPDLLSFHQLRRRAYAYGYLSEKYFF